MTGALRGDPSAELIVTTGPAANGGSCVARHDGRVVFVRYALPGELVRVRVTAERGAYCHAEVVEVLEASADRIEPLCPIAAGPTAGAHGAGCCDLAFADPAAARVIKGQVVANQLARIANYTWDGVAEPVGSGSVRGWRTRVRLGVDTAGWAGFHRYHSTDLVTDLRCGQLPDSMLAGIDGPRWRGWDQVHVVIDDGGDRHVMATARGRRRGAVVEGAGEALQRVGERIWRLPLTTFWQAHREAPAAYSTLVAEWATASGATRAWDLYGGAGLFAGALADTCGSVTTVDTARAASAAARSALADLPGVQVVSGSVRRFLADQPMESGSADIAVLDPPRAGAGREIIDLLARAAVPRVIHVGCEVAAFARDVGLYQRAGYHVEVIRVFDAFPLTHHVECIALISAPSSRR